MLPLGFLCSCKKRANKELVKENMVSLVSFYVQVSWRIFDAKNWGPQERTTFDCPASAVHSNLCLMLVIRILTVKLTMRIRLYVVGIREDIVMDPQRASFVWPSYPGSLFPNPCATFMIPFNLMQAPVTMCLMQDLHKLECQVARSDRSSTLRMR